MHKKFLFFFILSLFLINFSCNYFNPVGPIIQLGIRWYEGEAHKYYASSQEKIHYALKDALKKFSFPIIEERVDSGTIHIKAGDDDRFKVKISEIRSNVTKLSIRVNTMGDKPFAELIYRHIDNMPEIEQFASLKDLNDSIDGKRLRFR
jgi:hypothetical protein